MRILDAADRLFFERGVTAVTMVDVRDDAQVSLRRLYDQFPAKPDLVLAWLRHRHEAWVAWFDRELETRMAGGADVVDAAFDAIGDWLADTDFRGCGFINTLSEIAHLSGDHRRVIREHKQAVADRLAPLHDAPQALALLIDGAIVQSAVFASAEPVETARTAAHLLAVNR